MTLHEFLTERRQAILDDATRTLAERKLERYRDAGEREVAQRLATLYDLVREGARTRQLDAILDHAERIGSERFAAGYDFVEVQTAVHVLEEAIWRALLASYPRAEVGAALGVAATLLGAAKDRLAGTYVAKATQTHVPSLDLRSLFRGTQNTGGGAQG